MVEPERPVPGIKPAIWASSVLVELIRDLSYDDECSLDHHGYCQAHNWLNDDECPHARAQRFLAVVDAEDGGSGNEGKDR